MQRQMPRSTLSLLVLLASTAAAAAADGTAPTFSLRGNLSFASNVMEGAKQWPFGSGQAAPQEPWPQDAPQYRGKEAKLPTSSTHPPLLPSPPPTHLPSPPPPNQA